MSPPASLPGYVAAALAGATLWISTSIISGRTEAWDSPLYFSVAYPLAIALAGVLGYLFPHKAWRWGLTVMLVQALVLVVAAKSFGLLPLGMLLFGVLALPPIIAARIMATIRRKRDAA
jgi:peptidoglycan/LPS O-acetylase OafA/YrhL